MELGAFAEVLPIRVRTVVERRLDYWSPLVAGVLSMILYFAAFVGAQYCTTEHNCTLTNCPTSCSSVEIVLKIGFSALVIAGAAGFFVLRRWPLLKSVVMVESVVFLVAAVWIMELATR